MITPRCAALGGAALLLALATAGRGDPSPTSPGAPRVSVVATDDGIELQMESTGPAIAWLLVPEHFPEGSGTRRWILPGSGTRRQAIPLPPGTREWKTQVAFLAYGPARELGGSGTGHGRYRGPGHSTRLPWGDLAIVDRLNRRIQVLAPDGTPRHDLRPPGRPGAGGGELSGVSCSESGTLVAAERDAPVLYRFGPGGTTLDALAIASATTPLGAIQALPHGRVAVLLPGTDKVAVVASDGRVESVAGGFGTGPGRLRGPVDIAMDPGNDGFWVLEQGGRRIQKFGSRGGATTIRALGLRQPVGLGIAPHSLLAIADRASRRIHLVDPASGMRLLEVARDPGGTPFGDPRDVVSTAAGDLLVSDGRGDRVWWVPSLTAMVTSEGQLGDASGR